MKMRKTILTFSFLLFGAVLLAQPQQRGKFNPQEFKAKLESYITKEAELTPTEATAFYPIYFEMKGKQRQLQRQMFQLKKEAPCSGASDKDFAIAIQKIKDLGVEMAQLEVTYYKKLCTVVSPRKVYAAMQAEDRFHRKMLEDFGHGPGHPKGHRPKQD